MKKIAKNFRLNEGTINLLKIMSEKAHLSQTDVLTDAVHELAKKQCTPEEFLKAYNLKE